MARPPATETDTAFRLVLSLRSVGLTDDQFFRLCSDNRDLRIEMTAQKELIIIKVVAEYLSDPVEAVFIAVSGLVSHKHPKPGDQPQ